MQTRNMRKVALWGGVLYLITFVFSIPTLGLKESVLDHADFILGSGSENSVIWASIFDVICGLAGIGTAVALYPVTRRVSRSGAPWASSPPAPSRRRCSSSAPSACCRS